MTGEGAPGSDSSAADEAAVAGDGRLFCHRHPDRETWVRCGRCDRPICPRCAMQGPVGFRCKDCGKPAFDPLTSFTPVQALAGAGIALGSGFLVALIAAQVGFLSIFVGYFGGGLVAAAVLRATGDKRGPAMGAILFGGIVVGGLIAFGIDFGILLAEMEAIVAGTGEEPAVPILQVLMNQGLWDLIAVGAACVGAWYRIR